MNAPAEQFCENPLCENPGSKAVRVSTERPNDQKRMLCECCDEVFSWGVQHGRMSVAQGQGLSNLTAHLRCGFVVLTFNTDEADGKGRFEAWAYEGPLDFDRSAPVTFGVGASAEEAIRALDEQLAGDKPTTDRQGGTSAVHLSDSELATILAALRFHRDENLQPADAQIPDMVIREIATDSGRLKPLSYRQVDALCERLREDVSAQYDTRCYKPNPQAQEDSRTVEIVIEGGNAEVTSRPESVAVRIVDYDIDGLDEELLSRNGRGRACRILNWPAEGDGSTKP